MGSAETASVAGVVAPVEFTDNQFPLELVAVAKVTGPLELFTCTFCCEAAPPTIELNIIEVGLRDTEGSGAGGGGVETFGTVRVTVTRSGLLDAPLAVMIT